MDRFYLWYDRMPAVDPARYDSPEAYLEAVRYRPIDESFSWITSRESFDALFHSSESRTNGYVGKERLTPGKRVA